MATTALNTEPNLAHPDDFYAALLALHDGRSSEESERINARLILLLANHIGDSAVLREALETAAEISVPGTPLEGK
jgi:5-carboxymethyl-2-hydroxymuconate isomerase